MNKGKADWLLILIFLIALGIMTGYIKISGIGMPEVPEQKPGFGQLVSFSVKGVDKYTGSAVNVNAELWSDENKQMKAETQVNQALTSLGTDYPNTFSGYVMLGNDNYESTTDRGTEYYYVKYPVSWTDKQGLLTEDTIYTYAEETATGTSLWTFYDDNTAETTANITIGSGGTYTAASVKLKSSSNKCFGHPELSNAVGFCFNESTSGMFKEVKPQINSGTFTPPEFLSGKNIIDCYYVTEAVCDGKYFETDLYFEAEAGQDPTTSDYVFIIPVDKCYFLNDNNRWEVGFGDNSALASDTDCGIDSIAAALKINMA